ncbi:hypothetical protein [Flindersiella endophytica]
MSEPERETAAGPGLGASLILGIAFVLSVFHYADNVARFDRYALSPDSPVTAPFQVLLAWVIFTVAGVIGYVQLRRGRWWPAAVLVAFYSLSGFVGLGHYGDASPGEFDALQNLLIVTDILAGFAVLGLALWLVFKRALPAMNRA